MAAHLLCRHLQTEFAAVNLSTEATSVLAYCVSTPLVERDGVRCGPEAGSAANPSRVKALAKTKDGGDENNQPCPQPFFETFLLLFP